MPLRANRCAGPLQNSILGSQSNFVGVVCGTLRAHERAALLSAEDGGCFPPLHLAGAIPGVTTRRTGAPGALAVPAPGAAYQLVHQPVSEKGVLDYWKGFLRSVMSEALPSFCERVCLELDS